MTDHVTAKRRSEIMSSIRGKHTAPEIVVRKAAHRLGLRFRLHQKQLPGNPDLVFPKWRTVVFVNGCFWHQHPKCKKSATPKSNREFWFNKLQSNVRRDKKNYAALKKLGWSVVVIWQCHARSAQDATTHLQRYFRLNTNL